MADEGDPDAETESESESADDTEPLADLADEVGVETADETSADLDDGTDGVSHPTDASDTTERVDTTGGTHPDGTGTDTNDTEPDDAPLSELAESVAATEPLDDSPFEEMDTTTLDTADAWQRLEDDEQFEQPGSGREAEAVAEPSTPALEHVVDKRQYCQQCPYLSTPPAVACSHDGTEILEVTDADHFRVRACPMIGEDGPNFDTVDEE
ncbi:MAG: hypothetical protein J07HB67_02129 [halophilic archaeon J07HB67]|nr:MAG: hypothetical protein J07HB67_02129 [halophilic archaeon J07HB67]